MFHISCSPLFSLVNEPKISIKMNVQYASDATLASCCGAHCFKTIMLTRSSIVDTALAYKELGVPVSSKLGWRSLRSPTHGVVQVPRCRTSTHEPIVNSRVLDSPPETVCHYTYVAFDYVQHSFANFLKTHLLRSVR